MEKLPINEEFLQQLELLQLLIKNSVAGAFGGNHKTRTYGSSCEYADFRDYVPGDDLKKVDWNAYARFEKLYLKLFLDERQMHTRIYIDASRSMTYGNGNKDTQAVKIAAAIAYLSVCDMDKVSIYVIHENAVEEVITSMLGKDSFVANIGKLNGIVFNGDSCISDAVLPLNVGYGDGLSVIISDFLTDNNYEDAVNYLADRKRDAPKAEVTRLAPSPTGFIHLGNLYSALADERCAHTTGGIFYLRIEDTDEKRRVDGAVESVIRSLKYFGIDFDEGAEIDSPLNVYGPYYQRRRAKIYRAFVKDLIERGLAYPCFCGEDELNAVREAQTAEKKTTGYYGEYAKWKIYSNGQTGKANIYRVR